MNLTAKKYHTTLAEYFSSKPLYLDEAEKEKPNTRKLVEQPWQQTKAEMWDEGVATLCNLTFIKAKCANEMIFQLIDDFGYLHSKLPESGGKNIERNKNRLEESNWVRDIIQYSFAWNERRKKIKHGEEVSEKVPILPVIIPSVRLRSTVETELQILRITQNPTRLDLLSAFETFVRVESYPLHEHRRLPFFMEQHAYNFAPDGPVHAAASRFIPSIHSPLVLRRWHPNDAYNRRNLLLYKLEGHTNEVHCISVTPDGKRIVSGGQDQTFHVVDLENGTCRMIKQHPGFNQLGISSIVITPDGKQVFTNCSDGLLLWNLENGECVRSMKSSRGEIGITPDARRIIMSGGYFSSIRIMDLEDREGGFSLQGHRGTVTSVSITHDGKKAVSAGEDNIIRVWDLDKGETLFALEGHTDKISSVRITPDGRVAITGSRDRSVRLWDLCNGKCLHVLEGHKDTVWSVSITPDGKRAASGGVDSSVFIWDLENGACLGVLMGHSGPVYSVDITANGGIVASGGEDGTVCVWDLAYVAASQFADTEGHAVNCTSITSDGRTALSATGDRLVQVWDMETGECTGTFEGHTAWINSVRVTPNGHTAISGSDDKSVRLWNLKEGSGKPFLEEHQKFVNCVGITPDGRKVVSGSDDMCIFVFDTGSGECLRLIDASKEFITSVVITQDGRKAASGGWDNILAVWDLETGRCLHTLHGHTNGILSMGVTPDGKKILSGSKDRTVRIWDISTGDCIGIFNGHAAAIKNICVSSDGKKAISEGSDRTVRVWDIESGRDIVLLHGDQSCISSYRSQTGLTICGALPSGKVALFDVINVAFGPPILTAFDDSRCICPDCENEFTLSANTAEFVGDRMLNTECPNCKSRVVMNTFILSEKNYISSLRCGLEYSQQRSCIWDWSSQLGHLRALAFHLRNIGRHDEASEYEKKANELQDELT